MIDNNQKYHLLIKDLTTFLNPSKYIVVGSVATLATTKKLGYSREIHDLDIILDQSQLKTLEDYLEKNGYTKSTFINKRMPFYKSLMNESSKRYLRFERNQIFVDILITEFTQRRKGFTRFELYPNIFAVVPERNIINEEFTTLDTNLKYVIMRFLNETLGRFVTYKKGQRLEDLRHLEQLVDKSSFKGILKESRFYIGPIPVKIPLFLVK
ncbi:hypothetical protein HYV12_03665 [Candidatus Dojkabacteria bacterium]|nr:hypothetical protein [Candidatus Dojkabacteria bacterium]